MTKLESGGLRWIALVGTIAMSLTVAMLPASGATSLRPRNASVPGSQAESIVDAPDPILGSVIDDIDPIPRSIIDDGDPIPRSIIDDPDPVVGRDRIHRTTSGPASGRGRHETFLLGMRMLLGWLLR